MGYCKEDNKEHFKVVVISDILYFQSTSSIGGKIFMLASDRNKIVCPLEWMSFTIQNVCTSTKDAETRAGYKSIVSSVFTTEQVEKLLVGNISWRLKTELSTDSELFLKSISSSKRMANLNVINLVDTIKERILECRLNEISYIKNVYAKLCSFND